MTETLSPLIRDLLLITLQVAVFAGLLVLRRWKQQAAEYYNAKTTTEQRQWLRLVGQEAFHYAEQAFAHYDGPAKLNEAVKYVLERAHLQQVQITYPEIRAVVERAWMEAKRAS